MILGKTPASPTPPPRPTVADYPTKQLRPWQKILGIAASGAGAYASPTLGERISEYIFDRPKIDAQSRLKEAQSEYDTEKRQGEEDRTRTLTDAEIQARTKKLLEPPADKPETLTQEQAQAVEDLVAKGVPRVDAIGQVQGAGKPDKTLTPQEDAYKSLLTQVNPATKKLYTPAEAYEKVRERQPEPPKPSKQLMLVPQPDGSSKAIEVTPGTTVPKGAETAPEFGKGSQPTADEQRRADLSRNMNENLDQLEDILNRRPDLFGWFSGRKTEAAGAIGTSDPDIAALKIIKEQIGMAMLSAKTIRKQKFPCQPS
jgi:hypothetical protein